jgi:tetratricopeptide (TPR) repeat protein
VDRILPIIGIAVALFLWYRRRTSSSGGSTSSGRIRNADLAKAAAQLGFLPAERLDTDRAMAPDRQTAAVLEAVRAGNWQAGAQFLAEAGRDWQERDRRSSLLAREAAKDDSWLLAWRTAYPQDPGAALVHAESLIDLAWEIRGSATANHTTQEQFAGFHRVLDQARAACAEAQALGGDDPCPYIVEIPLAMGLGYPNAHFEAMWAEIVKRDPYHLAAHTSALQYWCAKWRGSHERAEAFAREAAAKGVPGQLLTSVLLDAYFEYEIAHDDLDEDDYYKRPEIVAAVDAALVDVAAAYAVNPHDRRIPPVRHMLANMLFWQDRYEAAVEQFRLVDGYIDTTPWSYSSDPVEKYVQARDFSAAQVVKARGGV